MKKKAKIRKTTMLVFGLYEGDRCSLDVPIGTSVGTVKKMFQTKFNIYIDERNKKDRNILVLHYGGADLDESWCFTDLGIPAGSTIKVVVKEEVNPVLFIYCTYNAANMEIVDKDMVVPLLKIEDLRTICAKKSGLPVSTFRLVFNDRELYDDHQLYDYGVEAGNTIRLENWDGWNEFLKLCIMGFPTPQVLAQISTDEVMSRFQMKVALFIAAHFGNVDLARSLIKQGVRSDEPIGLHPLKQWVREKAHIETKKCPVHEATENGQLGVLRFMVNHDITCIMARDGNDLTALNIALRQKVKPCALFLLTKQWSTVPVGKVGGISVQTLSTVKRWCHIAKEKCFAKYGSTRSSLKKKSFSSGPLVSFGLPVVDGVTDSQMTGKPRVEMRDNNRKKSMSLFKDVYGIGQEDPEHYFKQMSAVTNYKNIKLSKNTQWGNVLDKTDMGTRFIAGAMSNIEEKEQKNEDPESQSKKIAAPLGRRLSKQRASVSQSTIKEIAQPLSSRSRKDTTTIVSEEEHEISKPVKLGIFTKLKGVLENPLIDEVNERSIKTPAKPAFMGRLVSSAKQELTVDQADESVSIKEQNKKQKSETETKGTALKLPSINKRNDQVSTTDETNVPVNQTEHKENKLTGSKNSKGFLQTPNNTIQSISSLILEKSKTSTMVQETPRSPPRTERSSATIHDRKARKRKRLNSQAKASDGAVPLPIIYNTGRPFFYWNGMREEDYVIPFLDQVTKHKGASSRDRAIKSLAIANSFKEKPWLAQVRMAMSLTSQSLRRSTTEFTNVKN